MLLAASTNSPSLSSTWPIPVALVLLLAASVWVFRMLVRRWTTRRHWLDLSRWAESHRMKILGAESATVPPVLATVTRPRPTASISIVSNTLEIAQMHTRKEERTDSSQFIRWHVLVRQTGLRWPPTGLRARANASSILDLYPLTSYPSMAPPERFVIFGTDSAAARRISKSSMMALLPPDIGVLLHGSSMILDFTARPFDTIELSRLCELAEQLVAHIPPLE